MVEHLEHLSRSCCSYFHVGCKLVSGWVHGGSHFDIAMALLGDLKGLDYFANSWHLLFLLFHVQDHDCPSKVLFKSLHRLDRARRNQLRPVRLFVEAISIIL